MLPEQLCLRRPNGDQQGTIVFDLEFKAAAFSPPFLEGKSDSTLATAGMADDHGILEPRTPTRTGLPAVAVDDGPTETALEEAVDDGTIINTAGTLVVTDLEVRHTVPIVLLIATHRRCCLRVSIGKFQ